MAEDEVPGPTIAEAITDFTHDLEGIRSAEQIACSLISVLAGQSNKQFHEFADDFRTDDEIGPDGVATFHVPLESNKEFRELQRKMRQVNGAMFQTPRALLVAMVSAFDAYLGRLLRCIFVLRPEMIDSSERTLTFSELIDFTSLESAREHIVETEIEAFLRKSHVAHFEQLEKRLAMELRKGLKAWPVFVEVMQRRNLFVHCDGVVSKQYLTVCEAEGADTSSQKVGDRLHLDPDYFKRSYECLYEIGVKLGQTVWRKLAPAQLEDADKALNIVCYQLLHVENYRLAYELLTFATQQKKHSSAFNRRMFVINRAIAAKFGEIETRKAPLDTEDWSDCGLPFALAVAVLQDRTDDACELMRQIGTEHDLVDRMAYDTWPLFRDFREDESFRSTYKDLFGDEFHVPDEPDDIGEPPCDDE